MIPRLTFKAVIEGYKIKKKEMLVFKFVFLAGVSFLGSNADDRFR